MPVACKPKHDYQQGLLGMGKEGVVGAGVLMRLEAQLCAKKHLLLVPALHEEVGM